MTASVSVIQRAPYSVAQGAPHVPKWQCHFPVCFHEAAQLNPERWRERQQIVQRRVLRYFNRHGLLDEAAANGILSRQGFGGFSIDASVRIEAYTVSPYVG